MSSLCTRFPSSSDDVQRCKTDLEQCAEPALASRGLGEHVLAHGTTLIASERMREGARGHGQLCACVQTTSAHVEQLILHRRHCAERMRA